MNDMISRQAAIDAFYEMASNTDYLCTVGDYVHVLETLSAQPTDAEIQKMQDIEQAMLEKAYECGKQDAMQWIPCSEKAPSEAQECWITAKDGTVCHGMFTRRYGERRDSGFICGGFGFAWLNAVAAWKPYELPTPYREGEQE